MSGSTAWAQSNVPFTWISIIRSQSSSGIWPTTPRIKMPAPINALETGPISFAIKSFISRTEALSLTSVLMA